MTDRTLLRSEIDESANGMRVDRYIAERLDLFPRSQIAHRDVTVRIDGSGVKLSYKVRSGEVLEVEYAAAESASITAEDIELDIVFENDDVVVVNKPAGMVVHPAAGNWTGTLAQGLMHHVQSLQERFDDPARPGIVHRLDKDTSGVLIAAKHPEALALLSEQFKSHTTEKTYVAILRGQLPHSTGTVHNEIARDPHNRKRFTVVRQGGKTAITNYRILRHYNGYTFVLLRPETGRTHQLRVHMAHLGCPIVGDPIYARRDPRFPELGLLLHAYQLSIRLPHEDEARTFTARIPRSFRKGLRFVSDRS